METRKVFAAGIAVMAAAALLGGDALAAGSRSGGHGGGSRGGHGGSHGGSRGHNASHGHHGGHYGGYRGYYQPFYGSFAVATPYFAYPRYYYPPPFYYAPPPPDILYYCPQYGAYYPQIQNCPGGWQRVGPQAPPPALPPMPPY